MITPSPVQLMTSVNSSKINLLDTSRRFMHNTPSHISTIMADWITFDPGGAVVERDTFGTATSENKQRPEGRCSKSYPH